MKNGTVKKNHLLTIKQIETWWGACRSAGGCSRGFLGVLAAPHPGATGGTLPLLNKHTFSFQCFWTNPLFFGLKFWYFEKCQVLNLSFGQNNYSVLQENFHIWLNVWDKSFSGHSVLFIIFFFRQPSENWVFFFWLCSFFTLYFAAMSGQWTRPATFIPTIFRPGNNWSGSYSS